MVFLQERGTCGTASSYALYSHAVETRTPGSPAPRGAPCPIPPTHCLHMDAQACAVQQHQGPYSLVVPVMHTLILLGTEAKCE